MKTVRMYTEPPVDNPGEPPLCFGVTLDDNGEIILSSESKDHSANAERAYAFRSSAISMGRAIMEAASTSHRTIGRPN